MQYDVSFGHLGATGRGAAKGGAGPAGAAPFRLALMGDFSGRASKGELETGAALARRKPLRVDVDTLDDVLARLAPRIVVPLGDEGSVTVEIAEMDDFHPDQLVEALPVFESLTTLRRSLQSRAGFDRAAKEVLSWAGAEALPPPESRRARGGTVAVDRRLGDFARLTGRPAVAEASTDDLMRRLIGPFIVPATDNRQEALVARVDAALSDAMRRVLHNPEFQAAEALWRGVEMLVRGLETGARLEIVLYDISAEELAADLAAADDLTETGLYALLVEQPASDADAGPLSWLAGLYGFELAPPHADLLGRVAQLAGAAGAPFVAAIGPDALRTPRHEWHPLIRSAWAALQALPAAAYLGLASPRFLLRMPYGKRTDPIDAFAFEEFTRQGGLSGMLYGNPALLAALLAAQSWSKGGAKMALGAVNVVGDLPVYVFRDSDGDQVALPCTERLFTERVAVQVANAGVMPVVALRGRPEVRFGGWHAVSGAPLAGRWAPAEIKPPAPPAQPPAAPPEAAPAPAAAPATAAEPDPEPAPDADMSDLDSLLADLDTPSDTQASEPATEAPAEAPAEEETDDLDALLASLGAEPPAAAPDETDADLDALLASLK